MLSPHEELSLPVLTQSIGMITDVARVGTPNQKNFEKAANAAQRGMYQPGTSAHMRVQFATKIADVLPILDDTLHYVLSIFPHVIDRAHARAADAAVVKNLSTEDRHLAMNFPGFDRAHEDIRSFIRNVDASLREILSRTTALTGGKMEDIAYALLDAQMIISCLLRHRVCQLLGEAKPEGALSGSVVLVHNAIATSALAVSLRHLFREQPAMLRNAIDGMTQRQMEKSYAVPPQGKALFSEMNKSRVHVGRAAEDAKNHIQLEEKLPMISQLQWPAHSGNGMPEGILTYFMDKPAGFVVYHSQVGHGMAREVCTVDISADVMFSGKRAIAGDWVVLDRERLCVSPDCQFAELSLDLLPADALAILRTATHGLRASMQNVLKIQPSLRENVFQLGHILIHGKLNGEIGIQCERSYADTAEGVLRNVHRLDDVGHSTFVFCEEEIPSASPITQLPSELQVSPDISEIIHSLNRTSLHFADVDRLLSRLQMVKDVSGGKGSHTKYRNPISHSSTVLSHKFAGSHHTPVPLGIIIATCKALHLTSDQLRQLAVLVADITGKM